MTDFDSRVTMDVDFLLRKVPNTPEQLKAMLEEIIAVPTGNEFVTYEIKSIAPIAVAKKYAGIGASLAARIKNTKTPLNIDLGVGDMIVPKQEKRKTATQLEDFSAPTVNTYSLETTFASLDHSFTAEQFELVMVFDDDEAMQKKRKAFCRKTDIRTSNDCTVLQTIQAFLAEPFVAAVEGGNYEKCWSASENKRN